MKRVISFFLICIFSVSNLFAYGGKTHELLTKLVVTKLSLEDKIGSEVAKNIVESCNFPDDDCTLGAGSFYTSHFFDPDKAFMGLDDQNGTSWWINWFYKKKNTKIPSNALIAALYFLLRAYRLWNIDEKKDSMCELGKAVHYIEDMCCSAHQVNWKANLSDAFFLKHSSYESLIDSYVIDRDKRNCLLSEQNNFDFRNDGRFYKLKADNFKELLMYFRTIIIGYATISKNTTYGRYAGYKPYYYWDARGDDEDIRYAYQAVISTIYLFFKALNINL